MNFPRRVWQVARRWVLPIVEALVVALAFTTLAATVVRVDGISMAPTFLGGERVLVLKFLNFFGSPQRGDIVVFTPPTDAPNASVPVPILGPLFGIKTRATFIKRVIAIGGDVVEVRPRGVWVNGVQLRENYVSAAAFYGQEQRWEVPPDHLFLMGDNRQYGSSEDSRVFGPIPVPAVTRVWRGGGRAWAVLWPPDRVQVLQLPEHTFAPLREVQ
ncbi:MAG: signal peptidase I [Deinococcus sp.]|nr:signal peptidase I [Deinococcus sp.]